MERSENEYVQREREEAIASAAALEQRQRESYDKMDKLDVVLAMGRCFSPDREVKTRAERQAVKNGR